MKEIQKLISEIRTDLDSHNNMESYALMFSGYQQISHDLSTPSSTIFNNWAFKEIEAYCTSPDLDDNLIKQLKVSASVPFKIVKLSKPLRFALLFIVSIPVLFLAYHLWINRLSNCSIYSINLTTGAATEAAIFPNAARGFAIGLGF